MKMQLEPFFLLFYLRSRVNIWLAREKKFEPPPPNSINQNIKKKKIKKSHTNGHFYHVLKKLHQEIKKPIWKYKILHNDLIHIPYLKRIDICGYLSDSNWLGVRQKVLGHKGQKSSLSLQLLIRI